MNLVLGIFIVYSIALNIFIIDCKFNKTINHQDYIKGTGTAVLFIAILNFILVINNHFFAIIILFLTLINHTHTIYIIEKKLNRKKVKIVYQNKEETAYNYRLEQDKKEFLEYIIFASNEIKNFKLERDELLINLRFDLKLCNDFASLRNIMDNYYEKIKKLLMKEQNITSNHINKDDSILNNAFKLFGLTKTATVNDIKRAYKVLVKKNHPDLGGNSQDFIKITEAYEVLKKYYNF